MYPSQPACRRLIPGSHSRGASEGMDVHSLCSKSRQLKHEFRTADPQDRQHRQTIERQRRKIKGMIPRLRSNEVGPANPTDGNAARTSTSTRP